jgi:DNA mismatch endonuclease Vsr
MKKNISNNYAHITKNKLKKLYLSGLSAKQIAENLKVPKKIILKKLKKYQIKTRSTSEAVKIWYKRLDKKTKEKLMKTQFKKGQIPKNYIKIKKEKLERLYSNELSASQIAKKLGVSTYCIYCKFKKYNIPVNKEIKERGKIKKGQPPWNKGKTNVYDKETIEKIRKARLNQIYPKKDTLPERIFEAELKKQKIKYKKHIPILQICQPDFFIEPNLVIFVDGDYWHANPKFTKNRRKTLTKAQINNKKRDKTQNRRLKKEGFKVYRFWESDIKSNIQTCLNSIKK